MILILLTFLVFGNSPSQNAAICGITKENLARAMAVSKYRLRMPKLFFAATLCVALCGAASASTLGSIVAVRGHVSDIAIDSQHKILYAANFSANRVEVLSLDNQSLSSPYNDSPQPSALALSPDNHFLVVGHYAVPNSPSPTVTIIDLTTGKYQYVSLAGSVIAAAFGGGSNALLVTTSGVSLLDPVTGKIKTLSLQAFDSTPLPVPWATYPASVITGTAGVSGDGNTVYVLVDFGAGSTILRYNVQTQYLVQVGVTSTPALGPRVISVDYSGATFLAGWALLELPDTKIHNLAQFPTAPGVLNKGGHVIDSVRNQIYAQVVPGNIQVPFPSTSLGAAALLQVFDSDNLTVRETFLLQENLAGKALLDGNNMYAISDSGITVLPVGALSTVHRVQASQEDLFFQSNGCNQGVLTQEINIVDPGGNSTDFLLKSPSPGVTFSQNSGTTPATIKVFVDPAAFQDQKGTASVDVQIVSASAVNVPNPVRVLINTRNPDQKGAIYDVPGTIVDVLADPARDRFYVLRQDKNQVLAFDGTSMNQIAVLRTGNTPVQMAIAGNYLLVTNDNSQLVNVFDLPSLTPVVPARIFLPSGFYGRSIAVANGNVLLTTRSVNGPPQILSIDLATLIASPANTSIYKNQIDDKSVLTTSPSQGTIFMAMPDGTVGIYDTYARAFIASRHDLTELAGAYAALSEDRYLVGGNVFNTALVPIGQVNLLGGLASGISVVDGKGLLTSTPSGSRAGVIQRFSLDDLGSISPVRTSEAPDLMASITRTPLGQTGQTLLPFLRTLAPLSNGNFIVQLSTSGFTAIPATFDAPVQPPVIKAVTNAADQGFGIAAGGLVTVWGSGLSNGTAAAGSLPLSAGLNNVCLYVGTTAMPLLFVSPNQINAQLPFSLPAGASIVLSNEYGGSLPFRLSVQPSAPAIFRTAQGGPVIVRTIDGKMITDSTPIHYDETLIIYMTGMGPVTPDVQPGVGAPGDPLATTTTVPSVYIGGAKIFTLWSGLVPGLVGLYQVNAKVPFHNIPTGSNIEFTVVQGAAQTTVKLRVEQ
jgi:uncharacterized protein (TIGR03437 family)